MASHSKIRAVAIAMAASSLTVASVASAAPVAGSVSPLVALSAFGTPQSAAAVSQVGVAKPHLVALQGTQAPTAASYAMSTAGMFQDDRYDDDRDPNLMPLLFAIGAMVLIIVIFHDEIFDEGDGEIILPVPISPS